MSDFYTALFEKSPDAILVADNERRYQDANAAACVLLGISRERVKQYRIDDFAAPELRENLDTAWQAFLKEGQQSGEYELVRADGVVRRVEFHATANFVPGMHVSMLRDVTERRRIESETQERFRLTFEQAAVGMTYVDLSGRLTRANRTFAEFLGYSVEELLRMNFRDFTYPEDIASNVQQVEELIRGKRDLFTLEKRYVRKNGAIVWGKVSSSLLRHPDGTPAYTFGVIEDINERKQVEEEVRLNRERLDLAMYAAHAGSFDWDIPNNFIRWSPELERLYGLPERGFDGTYERWSSLVLPEDWPELNQAVRESLQTGEFVHEWRIRRAADGQVRWLSARARVLFKGSRPLRMIGISVDTTERNEAEEALRRSNIDLELQVESRTAALRSLSSHLLRAQDDERRRIARELHDSLGQYLAAIKMNLDLVNPSAPIPADLLDQLRDLAQQSLNETRTLSHLLHPPLLDEAGLASAASWYVGGFSQRSGVKVDFHLPQDLPRLPGRIETVLFRVLQESLTNIHRHSGSAEANIHLALDNGSIRMQITDHGRGIPPKLLTRFQQDGTGSGIGLAGMRERVRELGGDLRIASSRSGTTISVQLPIADGGDLSLPSFPEGVSAA